MAETLYAARGQSLTISDLYTVDPATVVASSVGAIGFALTGLAEDPTSGILYGSTSNNSGANPRSLVSVDKTTGAGTLIGDFGVGSEAISDICFDAAGQMYGWGALGNFYAINKTTGGASLIAGGETSGGGIDFSGATLYHAPSVANIPIAAFSDSGVNTAFGDAGARTAYGLSLSLAVAITVPEFRLVLAKVGAPADDLIFSVYLDAGGAPGTLLFSHTITPADFVTGTNYIDTGPGGLSLTNPNTYWFVLSRSGAVDGANYYQAHHQVGTNGAFFNGATWGAAGSAAGPWVGFREGLAVETVDPSTGAATPGATLSGYAWSSTGGSCGAASIRQSDGALWLCAADASSSRFMTLDPATGVVTHVGDAAVTRFDALAWTGVADVPDPSAGGMVGVAFDNGTLDETPTYTYLDLIDGVSIERVEIKRGRPDEHEKTAEGTATITGKDTTGALDPTNPTSPFYDRGAGATKLNPALQSTVRLQHPISEEWAPIYTGYVDDWDYDLDVSAKFFIWTLTLTDGLAILADAEVIPDNAGDTVPSESVGDVAYDPAPAADRIAAALADAALSAGALEWPASKMNVFSLNVHVRGKIYSNGSPLLTVIDDACDAEFPGVSNRFFDKFGVFAVRGRLARFDPGTYHPVDNVTRTPSEPILYWKFGDRPAFVADAAVAIISGLKFNRGKDALINAVLATPEGIKDSDIAGQFVKDATSIAKYSARSKSFPNLITLAGHDGGGTYNVSANDETKKVGDYYVDNYKTPRTRVRQIVVRTQDPDKPEGGPVWDALCGVELSDLITPLKTTHPGGGGFNEDFFIEGIAYLIVPMKRRYPEVTLTLDVSPRAYFDTNPYA